MATAGLDQPHVDPSGHLVAVYAQRLGQAPGGIALVELSDAQPLGLEGDGGGAALQLPGQGEDAQAVVVGFQLIDLCL